MYQKATPRGFCKGLENWFLGCVLNLFNKLLFRVRLISQIFLISEFSTYFVYCIYIFASVMLRACADCNYNGYDSVNKWRMISSCWLSHHLGLNARKGIFFFYENVFVSWDSKQFSNQYYWVHSRHRRPRSKRGVGSGTRMYWAPKPLFFAKPWSYFLSKRSVLQYIGSSRLLYCTYNRGKESQLILE